MGEPQPDGPFAEFAVPKASALENFQSRRAREQTARREYWLLLAILAGAAAPAAAGGACVAEGLAVLPATLALASAGALLGVLGGWLVGAATWGVLSMRSRTLDHMQPMVRELLGENSWDKLSLWLSVWGGIGIAVGASIGASMGVALPPKNVPDGVGLCCWLGSVVGIAVGFVGWLVLRRRLGGQTWGEC